MSFEAVPCMFKSRQEDGAEAALFGLLIRPSAASSAALVASAPPQGAAKQLALAADSSTTTAALALSTAAASTGSSSLQIVPSDSKGGQRTAAVASLQQQQQQQQPCSSSVQMVQLQPTRGTATAPFALLAPPGMPPILPRPKQQPTKTAAIQPRPSSSKGTQQQQQQQQAAAGIASAASSANGSFEAQSPPSQVVPQLTVIGGHQSDVLSIATSSSLPGPSTPQPNLGLLSIQSPNKEKQPQTAKDRDQQQQQPTEKRPSKKNNSNNGNTASKRIRRPKPQKQEQQEKNCPAAGQMLLAAEPPQQQQDGQLGEDLHAIEFSQLVNTTVITTEDYFRSQPEAPIYTNLDMYGPSQCHGNQQQPQQRQQQNNGTNGPMGLQQVNRVMERSGQQQQQQTHFQHADQQASCSNNNNDSQPTAALCHSAIYLHNQHQHHLQQQQAAAAHSAQNFPGPSTSSAQVRFLDPGSTTANGNCCMQQQQQAVQQHPQQQPFSTAQQQQQPPVGWHPYLVAHPGGGHISSTPDSGIQSIDGSPPSVYTPPMVSPYSSQVRSCESVGAPNGGGHAGANGILLCQNNGNNNFHCYAPGSNSGGLCCNGAGGDNNMLLISAPAICLQPQQQAPPRLVGNSTTMMLVNGHGHHDQQGHAEMMVEAGEEEDGTDGSSEDGGDFSDMPKLVPVTHSEQDEEAEESREMSSSSTTTATNGSQPSTSAAASNASPTEEQQQLKEASPQESEGAEAALLMGVPTELLMGRSMTLQELAECISASIPPEKLKQLTSLIQSKAANSAQQQQQQQQSNVVPTSSSAEQGSANEQQQLNQKKAKKSAIITSLSAEQQQPSTSTSSSGSGAQTQQKQPKRRKKPAADKMVVSTSRQPTELKTKCEKLASKVHSKGPRRPSQQSRPLSDIKVTEEKEEEQQSPAANEASPDESPEAIDEEKEAARAEREEQKLAAYRLKVRAHLARKLDAFLGQVCQQLDATHLGIQNEHWVPGHWPGWRRRLDWTQVHQRVAANQRKKENGTEEDQKIVKKRGRKKKLQRMEEKEEVEAVHQQQKTDGMEEEKKEQRESRKRRHEKEAEKAEKRRRMEEEGKRSQRPSRSKDEQKKKTKTLKKTTTPPIILNLSSLLKKGGSSGAGKKNKRKKTHYPSPSSRSRIRHPQPSTSSAAPANSMMANGGDVIVQLTPTITSNCIGKARRRKGAMEQQQQQPMPRQPPPALSAQQLAIIRAGHWFLARNLRQAAEERRRRPEEAPESAIGTSTTSLPGLLRQLLAKFCANCRRRHPLLFSRRRLSHQLARPIKMLLDQPDLSPALLMDRFDSLVKQFIGTGQPVEAREQIRIEYLRLKRNLDFQRVQPPLQKDQLQQFTEDRRRAPPPQQQQQPNASGKCRTVSGSDSSSSLLHRNLTVDTTLDLSYMDSPNPVGRWNADSATLSPSSDNRDHDCVRCICGMAEDDGVMTQCDQCHFWLHADCLDSPVLDDQKEFVCEFCTRRLATTPRVDIVLKPQPSIKLSGCNYFRTLVSSRGLQVRLNEAVYVERLINDKHKSILRELHEECVRKQQIAGPSPGQSPLKQRRDTSASSSGGAKAGGRRPKTEERQPNSRAAAAETEEEDSAEKAANNRLPNQWWPGEQNQQQMTAADRTDEFHRRDLRVFRVERLFVSPNGQRFIFGCYYARPHETFCDSSRMFYRNELFWTPLFDTLPLDSVVGRCLILEPPIWAVGRPKTPRYLEDDVYVCEYQIDRNQRSFEKIQPKNRYYINTEPYMFNLFPEKKRLKRDFTPFKLAIESESSCRKAVEANDQHQSSEKQQSESLKLRLCQANLEAVCGRIRDIKDQSSSIG